jgi:hypothetical protein
VPHTVAPALVVALDVADIGDDGVVAIRALQERVDVLVGPDLECAADALVEALDRRRARWVRVCGVAVDRRPDAGADYVVGGARAVLGR